MNYVLAFENQKITLYANKKTTPSRDGYMITQIKRSFSLFATISFFAVCFRIHKCKVNTFFGEYKIILYFLQDRCTKII